jgi:hypothetical protein
MLARLRGAIDSQIAAEQAKVRAASSSPANGRRRAGSKSTGSNSASAGEKDPSEFEDSDMTNSGGNTAGNTPSRTGTPSNAQGEAVTEDPLGALSGALSAAETGKKEEKAEEKKQAPAQSTIGGINMADLPMEVRVKLRKLDKMEVKYAGKYLFPEKFPTIIHTIATTYPSLSPTIFQSLKDVRTCLRGHDDGFQICSGPTKSSTRAMH